MAANRAAFDDWRLLPRMMRDTSTRTLGIDLFGQALSAPYLLAPIGALDMVAKDSERHLAAGVHGTGIPPILSMQASCSMEDFGTAMRGQPWWAQLYWSNNDEIVRSYLDRAERAGAGALVVTLDTSLLGWRTEDLDLGWLPFARGIGIGMYTSDPVFKALVAERVANPRGKAPDQQDPRPTPAAVRSLAALSANYPGRTRDNLRSPEPRAAVEVFFDIFSRQDLTWERLSWLAERTDLPIVVKGIQHRGDARAAVEAGVAGIIVSNHGGRQVDGAIASLHALPDVVAEVAGRVPVLFDSGVRGAADAVKALALGATAVCLGRPWVYGLSLAGSEGVREVIDSFIAELDLTMGLSGVAAIEGITADLLQDGRRH